MMKHTLHLGRFLLAAGLLAAATTMATAQTYPNRPIKVLVGVPPGGSTDAVARLFADWLREQWGQPTVVENKPGANTAVAADAVARSGPDGYTVLLATNAHITLPLLSKLGYDPLKDFAPVGTIGVTPYLLLVHPSVPTHTLAEFVAYAKARPGQLNYGSSGNGGGSHIAGEVFNTLAGTRIQHIPYKGAGPALTDTLGGQVQVAFNSPPAVAGYVKAGRLKALAVAGGKRIAMLPQVPTFAEAGLPGFDEKAWYGVFVPARTPKPVVDKLAAELGRMLSSPAVKAKLEGQGIEPLVTTPDQFMAMMQKETAELSKVIKAANIKID